MLWLVGSLQIGHRANKCYQVQRLVKTPMYEKYFAFILTSLPFFALRRTKYIFHLDTLFEMTICLDFWSPSPE